MVARTTSMRIPAPELGERETVDHSFRANVIQRGTAYDANVWVTSAFVRVRFSRASRLLGAKDFDVEREDIDEVSVEAPSLTRGPTAGRVRTKVAIDLAGGERMRLIVRNPTDVARRLEMAIATKDPSGLP